MPGLDTLAAIARSRNVSLDWLLMGDKTQAPAGEERSQMVDNNRTSHFQGDSKPGSYEGVLAAHMQLISAQNTKIIEQQEKIIRLLMRLVIPGDEIPKET